jgi:hypothetical protein
MRSGTPGRGSAGEPARHAELIDQWKSNGNMVAAVSQDLMCEPFILSKSGLAIWEHQKITIERYTRLIRLTDAYAVLQGYSPESYAEHVRQYGGLLKHGQWVGVGSVRKRIRNPEQIEDILLAIKTQRRDLRLHGFGLKIQALGSGTVRALLYSSDSMAWSYPACRKDSREHDPRRALVYGAKVEAIIRKPMFVQQQLYKWWSDEFRPVVSAREEEKLADL